MKNNLKYLLAVILTALSCVEDEIFSEQVLLDQDKVSLAANSARLVTKSGLTYTYFDEGTRYLLYCMDNDMAGDWSSDALVMDSQRALESADHIIDYGLDLHFRGRTLDFYGVTLCMTGEEDYPQKYDYPADVPSAERSPKFSIGLTDGSLPDLMYSNDLKSCTSDQGLLSMNFIHAMAKLQVEVAKQDVPALEHARIRSISIVNTCEAGVLDIAGGEWTLEEPADAVRPFYEGDIVPSVEPGMVMQGEEEAYMLVFPNEDVVTVRVTLSLDEAGEEVKSYDFPLYDGDLPYLFRQNHRYILSIMLLDDGVRVVAVLPQVYEWIEHEPDAYMGQPVTFGGLMWMDRNLGASSADCKGDWANTRGFYYQYGRNIPYIYDVEKFRNRKDPHVSANTYLVDRAYVGAFDTNGNISITSTASEDLSQLKIGYEYFYTYNEKGEKVYGALQGGLLSGFPRYMVDTMTVNGVKKGWTQTAGKWTWEGSSLRHCHLTIGSYSSTDGGWSKGDTYAALQIGKNGSTAAADWSYYGGPDVTSSNIAVNPGDPGIYQFIFDARYYHDYVQTGCWCVTDCPGCNSTKFKRLLICNQGTGSTAPYDYDYWLTHASDGSEHTCGTAVEDADKVNFYWADRDGNPQPENHPCPKGWRIPTNHDFANILPDHEMVNHWASNTSNRDYHTDHLAYTDKLMLCRTDVSGNVQSGYKEDILYGIESDGVKTIYLLKRKGRDDCYRIRIRWEPSQLHRATYYNLTKDPYDNADDPNDDYFQYIEISRYPGDSSMSFDAYRTESLVTDIDGTGAYSISTASMKELGFYEEFDWSTASETLQIPVCGFIYTALGYDSLFHDGNMTILRCTDASENYDKALKASLGTLWDSYVTVDGQTRTKPYNESMNWCAYIRTDRDSGLNGGSRKSLGCQIRCVRDVNAK